MGCGEREEGERRGGGVGQRERAGDSEAEGASGVDGELLRRREWALDVGVMGRGGSGSEADDSTHGAAATGDGGRAGDSAERGHVATGGVWTVATGECVCESGGGGAVAEWAVAGVGGQ